MSGFHWFVRFSGSRQQQRDARVSSFLAVSIDDTAPLSPDTYAKINPSDCNVVAHVLQLIGGGVPIRYTKIEV